MCRNDSIGPLQSSIGMKRTRQQEEDEDENEENGEKDLKKLWVNKRARLTTIEEDEDSQKIITNKDDSKAID